MNSNGANQIRLTDGYEPSVSALTETASAHLLRVAYVYFVINTNGTNRIRLTNNLSGNFDPAFSPDGSQIAFESVRDGGGIQIYLMNSDGSNQIRLTNECGKRCFSRRGAVWCLPRRRIWQPPFRRRRSILRG